MNKHTEGPWRVGDAGATVFGPPNGNPAPEVVANVKKKANARLIAAATCSDGLKPTIGCSMPSRSHSGVRTVLLMPPGGRPRSGAPTRSRASRPARG